MRLSDKILKRLKRAGTNRVFTRSDFLDLGSTHAIGMAIQRLLQAGKLRRVARGLYDVPRKHPLLGELSASDDAVAAACGYIKKLVDNAKVVRFLNANYSDIFSAFEKIATAETV